MVAVVATSHPKGERVMPISVVRVFGRRSKKVASSPRVIIPEIDTAALGIIAAVRLSSLKDSPRAVKRCANRRARELNMLDNDEPIMIRASRILLHECSVCGRCEAG